MNDSASDSLDEIRAQTRNQPDGPALLFEITQRIAAGGALSSLLTDITNASLRGCGADGIRLALSVGESLVSTFTAGAAAASMLPFDALILQAVRDRGVLEVPDLAANDLLKPIGGALGALIALPLTARKTTYGVLWVGYNKPNALAPGDRVFLSIVANQTAVAIANAYAFDVARQGREQLAAILLSSIDPVLVVDEKERIVLLNPAAELVFGTKAESAVGGSLEAVINAPPLVELFKNTNYETGEAIEWQSETGQSFAPRLSEMKNEDGTRTGRVLVLHDITRYKNLRDNQAVFVQTVSHDLRSPLTYMHGYATMLPMVGTLNDKQKGFAEKIVAGVAQMTDLVDKILDAGRLDPDGNYDLNREVCDIYKMVSDVVGNHSQPAEKKGLTLTSETDPGIPVLNLDDMMLRRALNNLVDNAIKYTPEGGKVTVKAYLKDKSLILSVIDTGLGISEENQKLLFGRFHRVKRREFTAVKGSGLGLFIVKSLAQKHNGDAWVESKEGEGSTFSIRIPMEGANMVIQDKKS